MYVYMWERKLNEGHCCVYLVTMHKVVCMYVRMCVRMYVRMYVRVYVCV